MQNNTFTVRHMVYEFWIWQKKGEQIIRREGGTTSWTYSTTLSGNSPEQHYPPTFICQSHLPSPLLFGLSIFSLSTFCYCVSDQRARVPYTLLFDSVSLDRRPGHGCRITWFLEAKQFDFSNIFVNICTCRQTNSEQVFIPHARAAYNKKPYIERTMMTGDETKVSTLHGYMIWLPRR